MCLPLRHQVHLRDGQIRYVEGNKDHPVNKGVLRDEIRWDHAALFTGSPDQAAETKKARAARESSRKLNGTKHTRSSVRGLLKSVLRTPSSPFSQAATRSQALTGWWARQFGTPNFSAHSGFCSVNMAAAGLYTIAGAFWEFGEPDWERTKYFMMFGVAEDHDSNPIKMGLVDDEGPRRKVRLHQSDPNRLFRDRRRMDRHPARHRRLVRDVADPRTLQADNIDEEYLVRYTNAHIGLVIDNPGHADDGTFAATRTVEALCWDKAASRRSKSSHRRRKPKGGRRSDAARRPQSGAEFPFAGRALSLGRSVRAGVRWR